jgi:hypothetical protein
MKERPILMNGAMVRAVLDGSKTQTRRIMKPQPEPTPHRPGDYQWPCNAFQSMVSVADTRAPGAHGMAGDACPHGGHGDRLWVRETWAPYPDFPETVRRAVYRADRECEYDVERWRPSIHMPRWASRIQLEIVSVRVERLQDISDADIVAEGIDMEALAESQDRYDIVCKGSGASGRATERTAWRDLWESTGGDWEANPWCWAIAFKRVTP